jgi:hypothetical protein
MSDVPDFDDDHLEMDLTIPESEDETTFPDVYVGLNIDLLMPGDGIVTDRHHASADRYEADDPQNQIAGQVSPFTLSGWLRHGCERVLQGAGATACHPDEANAEFILYEPAVSPKHPTGQKMTGTTDKADTEYRSPTAHETFSFDNESQHTQAVAGEIVAL